MKDKEETLKNLLKNLLEERLSPLEKRSSNQIKDLKLVGETFHKQSLLVNKLCSIKIEPKKPPASKNAKNIKSRTITNKPRDKTPVPIRSNPKNKIKKEVKGKRSMTPDISARNIHLRKIEKEREKEKVPLTKNKSEIHLKTKAPKPNNNNKIKPYVNSTNNESKDVKKNNDNKKMEKRALTPDIKLKNKKNKIQKSNKINKNTENNLKLVDLKIDSETKNEKKKENKKEEKIETKNEEKNQTSNFDTIIDDEKLIKKIASYLDTQSQFNFFSCNKKLIKYTQEKLISFLNILETKNDLGESSSVKNKISSLKLKYSEEQLNTEPEKFAMSKLCSKSIERLNIENYSKIFHNKELSPPLDDIIIIYRIFFQFLKDINFKQIKDDKLFWIKASDYILDNSNGKLGDFFQNSVDNLEFSMKNIFEAKKLLHGKEDKIKASVFMGTCGTTGLVCFLIKDILEYCGIILSTKKNVPYLCLKYLEYIEEMQNKLKEYIDYISNLEINWE